MKSKITLYNSVEDLFKNAKQRKIFTSMEIDFLVNKTEKAITTEIKKLVKWNKLEIVVLYFDNDKNGMILYNSKFKKKLQS